MKIPSVYVLGLSTVTGVLGSTCCNRLKERLGDTISLPHTKAYNATITGFWSIQEFSLQPACVLRPSAAEDVSEALKIISQGNCRFSIKGHGHAPAAGFANAEGGVTIDLTTLSSVSLNKDSAVAHVGAGAKWLDVYHYLKGSGVQVAGGRNGNVGVGGLLLGGGISHFTTKVGWACDRVLNYQVVLANGTLINANEDSHADLFVALKGGGNNFGVVTRFDLQTFPQGKIFTTTITYNVSQRAKLFEAFTNLLDSSTYDPLASLVTTLVYSSTSKAWSLKSSAVYTKPVANPGVFNELSTIPHETIVSNITTLEVFADEEDTPPLNWLFATATFRPSSENMREMFDILNKTIYTFNPQGGVTWAIAFEPLVAGMLKHSKDRNVLDLKTAEDGYSITLLGERNAWGLTDVLLVVLISALWPNSTADSSVESTARSVLSSWKREDRAKGLLQKFTYLNYAAPYQDPLKSLSKAERRFLRATSQKYDSEQILQRKVGGFKL